ncbi:MAG: alpha/beta hydrolase [Anaerolineae bacterium]|nr:alpha/beta hydrolase [Anaerolineae bacterium]MDW8299223.1 alpha/beta hydrolase [Anaerolineae bacterium]
MSAITIENDLVHYEALGRGRPVILVHGWLGSWRYWVPTMQHLSGKYRAYALDLWGFGDSGKDANKYAVKDQVNLLYKFFESMGIRKAVLVGHSLGAAVCLNFARQYPEFTHRLFLISLPLVDMGGLGDELPAGMQPRPIAPPPRPAEPKPSAPVAQPPSVTYSPTSETLPSNPFRALQQAQSVPPQTQPPLESRPVPPVLPLSIATVPTPSPESPSQDFAPIFAALTSAKPTALLAKHAARDLPDLEVLRTEVGKADEIAFMRTAQSLSVQNLALELKRLMTPTLLLHGEDDTLLPPPSESLIQRINRGKQSGYFLPLIEPAVGHFPMLQITAKFNRLLVDFLEAPDLTNVQFKDQWKRTIR